MGTSCRLAASALALLVAASAGLARAAPENAAAEQTVQDAKKERAKQHFLRGLEFARKDQNYDAALAEFLASRELFPTQVALLNAAISLTRLGRYDEALQMYQQLFELFGPGMTPDERALANDEMADLQSRLGAIELRVDVSDALVEVDGRRIGSTPLPKPIRVAPGTHVVRVTKPRFEVFEARVVVASQEQRELGVSLQPSSSAAPPSSAPALAMPPGPPSLQPRPKPPPFHVAISIGALLSPSFNGGAAQACNSPLEERGTVLPGCRDRKRPFGPFLRANFGYEPLPGLELDVMLGYAHAGEGLTRSIVASGEEVDRRYTATDYRDTTELSALMAALGVGYRARLRVPLTLKLEVGIARTRVDYGNVGTYAISVVNRDDPNDVYQGTARVEVPEKQQLLWLPLLAPELRASWQLSSKLSVDVGVGLLVLFGSSALRTGSSPTLNHQEGDRSTSLPSVPHGFADHSDVMPGALSLPQERGLGTVLAFTPSLGGRFEL